MLQTSGSTANDFSLPRGYTVTAVDLSAALIEENKKNLAAEKLDKKVEFVVADARNLSKVTQKDFDAVLLMGPLYHLIEESDRILALQQAYSRLSVGGIVVTAFISRFAVLSDLLKYKPSWIEDHAHVQSVIMNGRRPDDHPRGGFRGYLAQCDMKSQTTTVRKEGGD